MMEDFNERFVRYLAVCVILTFCVTSPLPAAIVVQTNTAYTAASTNTLSFNHFINNNANRMVIATVHIADATPADMVVSSLTYDGVEMTYVTSSTVTYDDTTDLRTLVYYLNESDLPGTGDWSASITLAGTCDSIILGMTSVDVDGVMTPNVVNTSTSSSSSAISTSVTTTVADALLVDAVLNAGPANYTATGTSQTIKYHRFSNNRSGDMSTRVVSSTGSYTFSYTATGGSAGMAHSMVAFSEPSLNDISGSVFEDTGYSGGVGRNNATASGVDVSGARVELFDSSGNYVSATTTDVNGDYTFSSLSGSEYTVRVVGSTVVPSVGGSGTVPVQTFRTNGTSGSIVDVTDYVGGEDPTKDEAGNGSTTLSALTTGSVTPQSITTVSSISADVTGVDFGFCFNVVSNTSDTGMGSLRQFIVNANAMSGANSAVFMISDGSAHSGLRSGMTNQLTSGVAVISLSSALPAITGTNGNSTTIDGSTQTSNVGNTNTGTLGTGSTVGTDSISFSTYNQPEVEIVFYSSAATGFDIESSSVTISDMAMRGSTTQDVNLNGSSGELSDCLVGITASSLALPGSNATAKNGVLISDNTVTVTRNLIAYCGEQGISSSGSNSSTTVTYNEVAYCGRSNSTYSGLYLNTTVSGIVRYNLVRDNEGPGIELSAGSGGTVENNSVLDNGKGDDGNSRFHGLDIGGSGHTVYRNIIQDNYGAGIWVRDTASTITISQNSMSGNGEQLDDGGGAASGQIGIDLRGTGDTTAAGSSPYYTINDDGDGDTGSNGLLNYPILEHAYISGANLIVSGWAPSGSTIELFLGDGDASGFGEGLTYLGNVLEGGGSDSDSGTTGYSSTVNCVNQGTETSTERFEYSFTKPGSVSLGSELTATATDGSGNTSEFSYVVTVGDGIPDFSIVKSSVTLSDPINGGSDPKAIPGAVVRYSLLLSNTDDEVSDVDTYELTCPIPAEAELYVSDIGGAGSGPVLFTDGATSSGLSYSFVALGNGSDDIDFSNDNGSTWTYTPTADGDGYDSAVTHIRLKPTGSYQKAQCGNTPTGTFVFNVRVL